MPGLDLGPTYGMPADLIKTGSGSPGTPHMDILVASVGSLFVGHSSLRSFINRRENCPLSVLPQLFFDENQTKFW